MKTSVINQIIEKKVTNKIKVILEEIGFKYSKQRYSLKKGVFEYEISISNHFNIFMDEDIVRQYDLYLVFDLYFESSIPEFEIWYDQYFSGNDCRNIQTFRNIKQFCLPLISDVDFQIPDDFDKNQKTYLGEDMHLIETKSLSYVFSDFNQIVEVLDFDKNIREIETLTNLLINYEHDFEKMALESDSYTKDYALLIFLNKLELPKIHFKNIIEEHINKIKSNESNIKEKCALSDSINYFALILKNHLGVEIVNPFKEIYKKGIKLLLNKNESIKVFDKFNYIEAFRIDISCYERYFCSINNEGTLLLFIDNDKDNDKYYLIDNSGNQIAENIIDLDSSINSLNIGNIENTTNFFISNYIINSKDGSIVKIDFKEKKEFFVTGSKAHEDIVFFSLRNKIILTRNGIKINEINAPKNTSIHYFDIENKYFVCTNRKNEVFVINFVDECLNSFKDNIFIWSKFFYLNTLYAFNMDSNIIKKTNLFNSSNTKVKTNQFNSYYGVQIKSFDIDTNLILSYPHEVGTLAHLYNKDFNIKYYEEKIGNENESILFMDKNYIIKLDKLNENIIVFNCCK